MNTKTIASAALCLLLLVAVSCKKNRNRDSSEPDGKETTDPIYSVPDLSFSEWESIPARKIDSANPRGFRTVKYSYNDKYLLGFFEYDTSERSFNRETDSLSIWIDNDDIYYDQGGGAYFSAARCFNLVLRGGFAINEDVWEWKAVQTYDWSSKGFGEEREESIKDVAYGKGALDGDILRFEFAVDRAKVGLAERSECTVGLLFDSFVFKSPSTFGHIVEFFESQPVVPDPAFDYDKVFYYDYTNFANPERGFYNRRGVTFNDGNHPTPPSAESMEAARIRSNATLTQFLVYFTEFRENPTLPDYVLDYMRQSFANHREAGVKTVLRCAYGDSGKDAKVAIVESHIKQLKPIFQEYADVIYTVEAGWVGACGEWANGDGTGFEGNAASRARVVSALLDAFPQDIQILLRTPGYKRQVLAEMWGRSYTKRDSITAETAFNGSAVSRIGGHNDCYMATGNDAGTYGSNDDRQQWRDDSRYTVMGGETCTIAGYEKYCNCTVAPDRMVGEHWSYLNIDYSQDVQNVWRAEGCFDEFVRRMGYRLTLHGVSFEGDFKAGSTVNMKLRLSNVGYACLMRERKLEFVLVDDANPANRTVWVSDVDPRRWEAAHSYTLEESLKMPDNLSSSGSYTLYLNLPDISKNLHDNPLYSIRLANKGVWNATLGMNEIVHLSPSDKPGDGVGVADFDEPLDIDFEW